MRNTNARNLFPESNSDNHCVLSQEVCAMRDIRTCDCFPHFQLSGNRGQVSLRPWGMGQRVSGNSLTHYCGVLIMESNAFVQFQAFLRCCVQIEGGWTGTSCTSPLSNLLAFIPEYTCELLGKKKKTSLNQPKLS